MPDIQRVLRRQHIVHTSPGSTVYDAACDMAERRIGAMAVVEGERLVGMFSERDLMTRVVVPGRDPRRVRVLEVMTRDVVTAGLGEDRDAAIAKMKKAGCRHLPIVAEGRLVGMISMRDLLRDEIDEQRDEIRNLRAYLYQQPPV